MLFLTGCSDNDPHLSYPYLRAAADFTVDTVTVETLCDDPGPNFNSTGFDPTETCRNTQKFVLRWERPEDTIAFLGYRLYLDTNVKTNRKPWLSAQNDDREAAVAILETAKQKDSLVFFFYDRTKIPPGILATPRPDTLKPGNRRIFGLDTLDRLEVSQNRFIFALATRYGDDRSSGQPQYVRIITGDKGVPSSFNPLYAPGAYKLDVTWARPNDPTSFFNPTADTGIISGYYLTVRLTKDKNVKERSLKFSPKVAYWKGGVKVEEGLRDSALISAGVSAGRKYFLPDGGRAHRGSPVKADSLRVEISNLVPQETYDVALYAVDSAGNDNFGSMPNDVTVILTDTTRPSTPDLQVDSSLITKNSFVVRWAASRDSIDENGDGVLEAGGSHNFRIAQYRLSRIQIRGPGDNADAMDRRDTVIEVTEANDGDSVFVDSARFLPPGKTYLLRLTAVDNSGFVSYPDSAVVTTDSVLFAGSDSGLTCPTGFVPIPSSTFRLGDSAGAADEKGDDGRTRLVRMGSYCIEPYEHRDSLGGFVTRATWEEADSICKAVSPADSTMLCSEVEWERACEGFDPAAPHLHGIQSERSPAILQASCNQATGDSEMAMSFELRNPVCLTNEGVYDMAGNLSEWVRDPYNPKAYSMNKDTVMAFGFTFPSAGSGDSASVHAIRGGNYLKPALATAQVQALARCSNRDFPMQVRPISKPECIDPASARIAVIYFDGLAGVKCFPVPPELEDIAFSDLMPDRDSSKVRYFISGTAQSDTIRIPLTAPEDSIFLGRRPLRVQLTVPSLAEVVFHRVGNAADTIVDTLDAREMRDTSQITLGNILRRESPSAAWTPKVVDGRFAVRKLHAYVVSGSKVAKPYYASRNIGFRCCSRPRPAANPPAMASSP